MTKVLALNGSLRASSSNHLVLNYLRQTAAPPLMIEPGPVLDTLPHFNPDLDIDPAPPAVATLRTLIAEADALLICTPEYTFSIPGSLKNALDWLVSSGSLYQKPVAVVANSTSKGGRVLAALGEVLRAHQAVLGSKRPCIRPRRVRIWAGMLRRTARRAWRSRPSWRRWAHRIR